MTASEATTAAKSDLITSLLRFYTMAEKLKGADRDNLLSDGRKESVAGHCWMMSMMAILLAPKMKTPLDLSKVFKIITVHDLAEAKTGDLPLYKTAHHPDVKARKAQEEMLVMRDIQKSLPDGGDELYQLWCEYEENATPEAKFVKGLDKLEGLAQGLVYGDVSYWGSMYDEVYYAIELQGQKEKYYNHEPVLVELGLALRSLLIDKMRAVGLDPEKYRKADSQ